MTPPRLARLLIAVVVGREDRRFVLADLAEEFERLARDEGPAAARVWYWRHALGSVGPQLRLRVQQTIGARAGRRGSPWAVRDDFRQAWRWLRRHPWVSASAVMTLAIALSAAVAALGVADAVAFRPLSYEQPEELVRVWTTGPSRAAAVRSVSTPDVADWRDQARSFSALTAYVPIEFRFTNRGEPRVLEAVRVARDFETFLGIRPLLGRFFQEHDFVPGGHRVAVLEHAFWLREFGGDRAAVGQSLMLDELPYEIVGILPPTRLVVPTDPHEILVPLVPRQGAFWETSRGTGWLTAVGRLHAGVSPAAAESELGIIARQLEVAYPDSNRGKSAGRVVRLVDDIAGPLAPMLALLGVALATVLLIASGNVVNLLLAAAASRRSEFAVRTAMGASQTRIFRQVYSESLIVCGSAGVLALIAAPALAGAFLAIYPDRLVSAIRVTISPGIVGGVTAVVIAMATMMALPVFVFAKRQSARARLGDGTRISRVDTMVRRVLVTGQVAMSLVLLVACAGLVKTVARLSSVDLGFRPESVLTFSVSASPRRFTSGALTGQFYDDVLQRIRAVPGVVSAASAVGVPLTSSGWQFGIRHPTSATDVLVAVNLASPAFVETFGLTLSEGRFFSDVEQRTAEDVAVVNEPLARLLVGERSAVGETIRYSNRPWRIVGVLAGARQRGVRQPPVPELFIPWHMAGQRVQIIGVRTAADPESLLPQLAAAVHAVDPSAPLANVRTLEARVRAALEAETFRATLLTALSAVAVGLAALGTYTATAYAVVRRRREYGIRLALGERPGSILRRALWMAGAPALHGVVLGVLLAVISARWLAVFLYEINPRDAATLGLSAAVLLAICLTAAGRSARAAARTDPVTTLRVD
jgi:predicted permease